MIQTRSADYRIVGKVEQRVFLFCLALDTFFVLEMQRKGICLIMLSAGLHRGGKREGAGSAESAGTDGRARVHTERHTECNVDNSPISGKILGWSRRDLRLFSTRVGDERSFSLISRALRHDSTLNEQRVRTHRVPPGVGHRDPDARGPRTDSNSIERIPPAGRG